MAVSGPQGHQARHGHRAVHCPVRGGAASPDLDGPTVAKHRQSHLELANLRGHLESVNSVGYSPDGQRIVSASDDGTIRLWEAISGRDLADFNGHEGRINSVAFSPDGRRIVTAGENTTAKVWSADSGQELFRLKGHLNSIWSAVFTAAFHS